MVVNDPPNTGSSSGPSLAQKSTKQMTKAERRELQERQRAAKAEKAAAGATGGGGKQAQNQKPQQRPPTLKEMPTRKLSNAVPPTPGRLVRDGRDLAGQGDDTAGRARGLRIFQHFDRTKPTAGKGDIHPAIVRLGLQFSEFKISGANARCIATLTAFKAVCVLHGYLMLSTHHTSLYLGHTRLHNTPGQYTVSPSFDLPITSD
jgi:translation initiation factor eIF-2B subunit delta